jgi:hypothetical protein
LIAGHSADNQSAGRRTGDNPNACWNPDYAFHPTLFVAFVELSPVKAAYFLPKGNDFVIL